VETRLSGFPVEQHIQQNTDTNATENSKEQLHLESKSIQSCIAQISYTIDINVHPLIMK